ncbi:MAG: M1 family metallopeptidase [Gemmatimonadales bacterium]
MTPASIFRPATLALLAALGTAASSAAQGPYPERAIRRDIPITNAIRRALAAGSRDSTGRPSRRYWQLRTDYTIRVSLDPATQRLTGTESVVIHNASPDSLDQIAFRLDPNLFLGNTPQAASWVPAEITDGMVISRMTVDGAPVNLDGPPPGRGRPGPPAEAAAVGLKTTTARVLLPKPIAPGTRTTIEIDWSHKLPGGPGQGHRMTQRWADSLFQPTQWYPRVAVYDDLRGWDAELYLGPSEFYNNFGRFDVSIDVPAGWLVSGTGVLRNPEQVLTPAARARLAKVLESDSLITIVGADDVGPGRSTARGDRLTWHFVADTVNDFAWATARQFVWRATRATIPGHGPIPINLVHLPGRAQLFDEAGAISRHALEFYSKLWFAYPFPQLTLQDGPSAGMEYPMVINSNRGAADHETGHQWWPMTVSNNETWYGWMDEGFNQYMNILSAADTRHEPANLDGLGQSYGRNSGNEAEPPMMWNANYAGPQSYGFTTYSKTPLMLSMLGGIVGDSAVQRAHREWGQAWMFKHPSPWDYMFFMNRALGRDLSWFWYYWLFTTESVEGSLASVTTRGGETTVTVRQDGQMPSPVVLEIKLGPGGGPGHREMVVAPIGAEGIARTVGMTLIDDHTVRVVFPVDIWFNGARTFSAAFEFGRPVERVTLDPDCRFPDRNPADNVWPAGDPPACATPRRGR